MPIKSGFEIVPKAQFWNWLVGLPWNRILRFPAILICVALLMILMARVFGPVRPLQDVVSQRLSRDGVHSGPSQENQWWKSRIAEISWAIDNRDVYISLSPQGSHGAVSKSTQFSGIPADLLENDLGTWVFPCNFNTLLFNYGRMEVGVTGAENPAKAVPEVHRLLRCG